MLDVFLVWSSRVLITAPSYVWGGYTYHYFYLGWTGWPQYRWILWWSLQSHAPPCLLFWSFPWLQVGQWLSGGPVLVKVLLDVLCISPKKFYTYSSMHSSSQSTLSHLYQQIMSLLCCMGSLYSYALDCFVSLKIGVDAILTTNIFLCSCIIPVYMV